MYMQYLVVRMNLLSRGEWASIDELLAPLRWDSLSVGTTQDSRSSPRTILFHMGNSASHAPDEAHPVVFCLCTTLDK